MMTRASTNNEKRRTTQIHGANSSLLQRLSPLHLHWLRRSQLAARVAAASLPWSSWSAFVNCSALSQDVYRTMIPRTYTLSLSLALSLSLSPVREISLSPVRERERYEYLWNSGSASRSFASE